MSTKAGYARLAAKRAANVAAGLCKCGKAPPEPRRKMCRRCLDQARDCERRRTARRNAAGLCSECGSWPHPPGMKSCARCLRKTARAQARTRATYRAQGLCGCGKPLDKIGVTCSRCRADKRDRQARYAAAGLCWRCGRERKPGYMVCERDVEKQLKRHRKRVARLRRSGLCVACGRNPRRRRLATCGPCAEANRQYHRDRVTAIEGRSSVQ